MKTTKFTTGRMLLVLLITGLTIGLVSWDQKRSPGHFGQPVNDTVPKTKPGDREKKIRDLDDVLDELDNVEIKIDMEKIQREIKEAMKKIDGDKIKMDVEKALRDVDMEKIKRDVEESVANIEWDKIKMELDKVKEIEMPKIEIEMKNLEKELSKIGPEIEKAMEKAKVEIEKAKKEMKDYNDFVDGLENDGLLNRKEGYTIKHKDRELFINGKKASDATYKKYRSFLEKHKTFKIEKSDDDFNIDID